MKRILHKPGRSDIRIYLGKKNRVLEVDDSNLKATMDLADVNHDLGL